MGWFSWGGTSNEMGEYLPDDEATLQECKRVARLLRRKTRNQRERNARM
ncbi:hypothetical protein IQ243_26130 [Nostocales cyanobacterium LEGE 11386]|nr:hypothetical protein [Nostocales cyanobacterium LEGE 11386]